MAGISAHLNATRTEANRTLARPAAFTNRRTGIVLGCALLPWFATAQEAPLASPNDTRKGAEELGPALLVTELDSSAKMDASTPADNPLSPGDIPDVERRNRWWFEPHFHFKGTYDDNIFIAPKNPTGDYVMTFAPGLAFGFWRSAEDRERFLDYRRGLAVADRSDGSFLAVEYAANILAFAKNSSLNTVNNDARFDVRWEREKLSLGASFHFLSQLETQIDPGRLVSQQTISSALNARYKATGKSTIDVGLYQTLNEPEGFVTTQELRAEGFFTYAVTPRLQFGFGTAGGQLQVDKGSNQVFERVLVKAGYVLTDKLEAEFRGGVEFRQSTSPGNRTNPIFEMNARWTPVTGTRFSLGAYRRVDKSLLQPATDFAVTGVDLKLEREIGSRFVLTIGGGYETSSYIGEARTDDYFYFKTGLSYAAGTWGLLGIAYEYRRNDSTRSQSSFDNNRISVEANIRF